MKTAKPDAAEAEVDPLVDKDEKKKEKPPSVPYRTLYRYAQPLDWLLISIGMLCAVVNGLTLPALFVLFGEVTSTFTYYGRYKSCGLEYTECFANNLTSFNESTWNATILPKINSFPSETHKLVTALAIVGVIAAVVSILQLFSINYSASRQIKLMRIAYFRSILRQDIGFHDTTSSGDLNTRLASDIVLVHKGLEHKASLTIQNVISGLVSIVLAFIFQWKLAMVTLVVSPFVILPSFVLMKVNSEFKKRELQAYATAGSIVEETISSIKTVVAFGCQLKEAERYGKHLSGAKKVGILRSTVAGLCVGLLYLSSYGMYGLSLWYGTILIIQREMDAGAMISILFLIMIGAYCLAMSGSFVEVVPIAQAAGAKIFEVIDRVPEIDAFSDEGDDPNLNRGEIVFKDVDFSYPTRPDVEVIKGLTFTVEHDKRVALVGQSGCGKSTVIQLIQRFYDVKNGSITIGGKNVRDLKVKGLRDLIGVVSQEPVLFATTLAENIRWGREGVTDEEIHEAAKQANAYDFIMKLPEKFETMVGEGGSHMSGGQKQRVAIARAIVRNPKILLLDEATSSLDSHSETVVQAALDKASEGRTTVVVAHRLSTIRNADKIIAIADGELIEEGTHEELLQIENGAYSNLIKMQASREVESSEDRESNEFEATNHDGSTETEEWDEKAKEDDVMIRDQADLEASSEKKSSKKKTKKKKKKKKTKAEGEDEEDDDDDDDEDLPEFSFMRILKMNSPEWPYLVAGCFFALIAGVCDPINAILFSEIFKIETIADPDEQYKQASLIGILFFVIGLATCLGFSLEGLCFGKSGMELVIRMRILSFRSILRQEIAFFDDHKHRTGILSNRLSIDANRVQGCTGSTLGLMLKNIATLGVALGISFAFGWKITLVVLAFIPLVAAGGVIEAQVQGSARDDDEDNDDAGALASEAIINIRTVASLTKEQYICGLYAKRVHQMSKGDLWRTFVSGLAYGFSQCILFFAFAAAFAVGMQAVRSGEMEFDKVFLVLIAVIFGAMAVGQNSAFAPDFNEAKISATKLMALVDRVPSIDSYSTAGDFPAHCKGEIKINSVLFRYPTRPDVPVLKGLDISVKPGQTLAVVGQSGCGKSTTTKLIERFYDPDDGTVFLDGVDIRKLNVSWLRQQMGLVSQEPVLFNTSIKENILYGDCTRVASDAEVEEAAEKANINKFISELPEGYNTNAGSKGGQLSGGQKQRVAIARALLRNPKILLLDEATSALDTENEKIVQEALDGARAGRTSIVIAHRLSTVRNADRIVVIDSGCVVESGTHDELLAKQGSYYSLVNAQIFTDSEDRE